MLWNTHTLFFRGQNTIWMWFDNGVYTEHWQKGTRPMLRISNESYSSSFSKVAHFSHLIVNDSNIYMLSWFYQTASVLSKSSAEQHQQKFLQTEILSPETTSINLTKLKVRKMLPSVVAYLIAQINYIYSVKSIQIKRICGWRKERIALLWLKSIEGLRGRYTRFIQSPYIVTWTLFVIVRTLDFAS